MGIFGEVGQDGEVGEVNRIRPMIQRRADVCSLARLKIDGVSGCGVTRYREELRIFVKL